MSSATLSDPNMEVLEGCELFLRRYYSEEIKELAGHYPNEKKSLYVEWSDLYQFDADLADDYLDHPQEIQKYLDEALATYDLPIDVDLSSAHVRVTDTEEFVDRLRLSDVDAHHIGNYIAVKGQLSKVTEKKPLLEDGAFECELCGVITRVPQSRTSLQEPHECHGCERKGPFKVNIEQSEFVDQRKLKVEAPPDEAAQAESMSTPVHVKDDLCDFGGDNGLPDRAGERCTVLGIRRLDDADLGSQNGEPEFDTWIDGRAIIFEGDDMGDVEIEEHKEEFEQYASQDDPVTLFRENISPGLEADDKLEKVLEASVAWLFGAPRAETDEGQYRGDIHFGVIGDPGTGKSTLLAALSEIAPLCEFRSGTGLSKVGLTAAAIQEEFAGKSKWTLEPGILPRANGGHCIIDEVDDVIDGKTKAIHDALENDQMVKVDKAGMSANLQTRTALLASGNPIHGRFNRHETIAEQVDLDPALISRMDILLDLPDQVDRETDRMKGEHYLESYDEVSRKALYDEGEIDDEPEMDAAEREVSAETLRAWVAHARENVHPVLTSEAKDELLDFYLEVRNLNGEYDSDEPNMDGAIPATPRKLGAGVRIATAFARVELSDTVTRRHARRAKELSQSVIGLNYDPETGEFDAGRSDTGKPKSQQDRVHSIRSIVDDLADETEDGAPVESVIEHATELGISESKAEHEVENLKQKQKNGLYEPKIGYLRTT